MRSIGTKSSKRARTEINKSKMRRINASASEGWERTDGDAMASDGKSTGGKSALRVVKFETLMIFLGTRIASSVRACEFPVFSLCRNHAKPGNNASFQKKSQKVLQVFCARRCLEQKELSLRLKQYRRIQVKSASWHEICSLGDISPDCLLHRPGLLGLFPS